MKKDKKKSLFYQLVFGFFVGYLFMYLSFNIFNSEGNRAEYIQNIISFLSLCVSLFIGWLAYEIQKEQKNFNEKSLTDYQRDFLRKSFREFCFYNDLINKIDYQISSLDQNQRNDYDVRFCLAQRVYQWIAPQPNGKSYFEQKINEGYWHIREAANYQIFYILHDKVLEIEIMAFQDFLKEINQKEKYKEIPNFWKKHILEKFEYTENVIFKTIKEVKNSEKNWEKALEIAQSVQKKLMKDENYMNRDGVALEEAIKVYQKYLSNRHI